MNEENKEKQKQMRWKKTDTKKTSNTKSFLVE